MSNFKNRPLEQRPFAECLFSLYKSQPAVPVVFTPSITTEWMAITRNEARLRNRASYCLCNNLAVNDGNEHVKKILAEIAIDV